MSYAINQKTRACGLRLAQIFQDNFYAFYRYIPLNYRGFFGQDLKECLLLLCYQ